MNVETRTSGISYSTAILNTPTLPQASSTCQIRFWFIFYNSYNYLNVNLYFAGKKQATLLRKYYYPVTYNWTEALIDLGRVNVPFNVAFEGTKTTTTQVLAIDDVSFENCALPYSLAQSCSSNEFKCNRGNCVDKDRLCDLTDDCGDNSDETLAICSSYQRCTFDYSFCDWTYDTLNVGNLKWTRRSGPTITFDTGPDRDHTTGLDGGYYIFLDAYYGLNKASRLYSRNFKRSLNKDCKFLYYYHMFGSQMGSLNVYLNYYKGGSLPQLIWSKSDNQGRNWYRNLISIQSNVNQVFQIIVEGYIGKGSSSDIALDDTAFSPECEPFNGDLPDPPTTLAPLTTTANPCGDDFRCSTSTLACIKQSQVCDFTPNCADGSDEVNCGPCDFESGLCGWSDKSSGIFSWKRNKANTTLNGPTTDHTSTTGFFANVGSGLGIFYESANLVSPKLPNSSDVCLMNFFYYTDGEKVGSLKLRIEYEDGTLSDAIWTRTFSPPFWYSAAVNVGKLIGPQTQGWKLRFEALPNSTTISNYNDKIALDDISFTDCNPTDHLLPLKCDFEVGLCGWSSDLTESEFTWIRNNGSTDSAQTGPPGDHTSGKGFYVYIETSYPRKKGDRAKLKSPLLLSTTPEGSCVTFWYHMYGSDVGQLNLIYQSKSMNQTFWIRQGQQGNLWVKGQYNLISQVEYSLTFEGVAGNGFRGDIALDDIEISHAKCNKLDTCDFENDLCDFKNIGSYEWKRGRNGTSNAGTGPKFDHTIGSEYGFFVYMDTAPPRKRGDQFAIESSFFSASSPRCVTFWYHMNGDGIGNLNVYRKNINSSSSLNTQILWQRSGDQDDMWRLGRIDLPTGSNFQFSLIFEGIVGSSSSGDIALDDISVKYGSCPQSYFCDFETDMCGWTNAQNGVLDDFDWLRNTGGSNSLWTGPSVDATTDSAEGWYMYIDSSSYKRFGEKAWLVSEHFNPQMSNSSRFFCVTFYYHMFGSGIGNLSIYSQVGKQTPTLRWFKSGNSQDKWFTDKFELNEPAEFVVIFEGTHGSMYRSDIAIDDIGIFPYSCNFPITTTAITTVFPHLELDCDFENDLCSWTNDEKAKQPWLRNKGFTLSEGTGPLLDHTLQSIDGHYIYLETSYPTKKNDTARLLSQPVGIRSTGYCFKFWYHMYGEDINTLNIKLNNLISNDENILWTRNFQQGNQWRYGQVYVKNQGNYRFVIEGVAGDSYEGDIAIDDIYTNLGSCPSTQFCDFESEDLCGFSSMDADFEWTWHQGKTDSINTGPSYDHV